MVSQDRCPRCRAERFKRQEEPDRVIYLCNSWVSPATGEFYEGYGCLGNQLQQERREKQALESQLAALRAGMRAASQAIETSARAGKLQPGEASRIIEEVLDPPTARRKSGLHDTHNG